MSGKSVETSSEAELRSKAVLRLGGRGEPDAASRNAPPAYGVLHKLALSPSTAVDALALLHELQVHQVELELQAEEMRGAYAELEAILHRQRQLYDSAPVGCFTVDSEMAVVELNSMGAQLLGVERDQLLGQSLHGFLTSESAHNLQSQIRCLSAGQQVDACTLQLKLRDGKLRAAHATVNTDPAGSNFLVAFMNAGVSHPPPTADSPSR